MSTSFWKIKHKPTGLYYKPSSGYYKSNLSKSGKVYTRKPSLKWLGTTYRHPLFDGDKAALERALSEERSTPGCWSRRSYQDLMTGHEVRKVVLHDVRKAVPGEWEIVEFKMEEA